MTDIKQSKILIVSTNGFEQSELETPLAELKRKGATVHVATLDGNAVKGWDNGDWGKSVDADLAIGNVSAGDYDALVIPGGQINPDILRTKSDVLDLVRVFHDSGKVIAAICHAPWVLLESGILKGRDATSYASIATDVKNAGAHWQDSEVVVDRAIITSRSPDDLPAFVAKIVEEIEEGRHTRTAA